MTQIVQSRDHRHAAFTQSFIIDRKRDRFELIGCEIPFNHYGDRGVVDVVMRKSFSSEKRSLWLVCEMKPSLYDIGEAIRQVRRAQEYFCKARPDIQVKGWINEYQFPLVLGASRESAIHVVDTHRDLFAGIDVMFHHEAPQELIRIRQMAEILKAIVAVAETGKK